MKRITTIIFLALAVLAVATGANAGEYAAQKRVTKGVLTVHSVIWQTDASGGFTPYTLDEINGLVLEIITDPDGSAAPTDNYDIILEGVKNYAVVASSTPAAYTATETRFMICGDTGTFAAPNDDGVLANRDTAVTESVQMTINGSAATKPSWGPWVMDVIDAGNSKRGTMEIIYLRMD